MTSLQNKVAIITGSTSGIGEAIARTSSREGTRIVINSVSSRDKGDTLAKELQGLYCQADIAIEEDCDGGFSTI
jgi:ketoreductase RED2